ncbi:MAG TPA: DeoR family transcriptional regulator [Candidatus Gracilibacteria bacterium]|nr:DeoR family transcriptional regulator [Candidatus Gracilibacteria bacterium]
MDRKQEVLKAIVKHFINTAEPVGSQTILVSYKFSVSPATIRNDMAALEKEGLIYQPHTSAGRVPTDTGYRLFVEEIADYEGARKKALQALSQVQKSYTVEKVKNKIYDAVELIARCTDNVSFATIPDNDRTFYLGLANVLKQPEFLNDSVRASQVIEVLERHDHFVNLLSQLDIDEKVKTFIGKENIMEQIQSCSLMVTTYNVEGYKGYFGLLGPTRMNYPFNRVIVEEIRSLLHKK